MTGPQKKAEEPKTEPKADDRAAKLEKEVAALKDLMRANGWSL